MAPGPYPEALDAMLEDEDEEEEERAAAATPPPRTGDGTPRRGGTSASEHLASLIGSTDDRAPAWHRLQLSSSRLAMSGTSTNTACSEGAEGEPHLHKEQTEYTPDFHKCTRRCRTCRTPLTGAACSESRTRTNDKHGLEAPGATS